MIGPLADLDSFASQPIHIGPYRLLRRIGHGGMAEVYLARSIAPGAIGKLFAIKVLHPSLRDEPGFEAMLRREATVAEGLDHPNIVRVEGFSEIEGYIAMEYVSGPGLRELLRRSASSGGPGLAATVSIAHHLCQALHLAHEAKDSEGIPLGLVHRDVTPSNILLTFGGQVKLADFGIAKATARSLTTIGGAIKGKFGYMPPEQYRCEPMDRRADIFSLGVVMAEMMLGRRLLPGNDEFRTMGRILRGDIPTPRDIDPRCPAGLNDIVVRATATERSDRYSTTLEICEALETFADSAGLEISEVSIQRALRRWFPEQERIAAYEVSPPYDPFSLGDTELLLPEYEPGTAGDDGDELNLSAMQTLKFPIVRPPAYRRRGRVNWWIRAIIPASLVCVAGLSVASNRPERRSVPDDIPPEARPASVAPDVSVVSPPPIERATASPRTKPTPVGKVAPPSPPEPAPDTSRAPSDEDAESKRSADSKSSERKRRRKRRRPKKRKKGWDSTLDTIRPYRRGA